MKRLDQFKTNVSISFSLALLKLLSKNSNIYKSVFDNGGYQLFENFGTFSTGKDKQNNLMI